MPVNYRNTSGTRFYDRRLALFGFVTYRFSHVNLERNDFETPGVLLIN